MWCMIISRALCPNLWVGGGCECRTSSLIVDDRSKSPLTYSSILYMSHGGICRSEWWGSGTRWRQPMWGRWLMWGSHPTRLWWTDLPTNGAGELLEMIDVVPTPKALGLVEPFWWKTMGHQSMWHSTKTLGCNQYWIAMPKCPKVCWLLHELVTWHRTRGVEQHQVG